MGHRHCVFASISPSMWNNTSSCLTTTVLTATWFFCVRFVDSPIVRLQQFCHVSNFICCKSWTSACAVLVYVWCIRGLCSSPWPYYAVNLSRADYTCGFTGRKNCCCKMYCGLEVNVTFSDVLTIAFLFVIVFYWLVWVKNFTRQGSLLITSYSLSNLINQLLLTTWEHYTYESLDT